MKELVNPISWTGPKGDRVDCIPIAPAHIQVIGARLQPSSKIENQEILQLKLRNYGLKDEEKTAIEIVYSDQIVGRKLIGGIKSGEVIGVEIKLQLPPLAYSFEKTPLKINLNNQLIGIEHVLPSSPPREMTRPIEGLRNRPTFFGGPSPDCLPMVDLILEPEHETFFTDETFRLNWNAHCASFVSIKTRFKSAGETLSMIEDARRGVYHDARGEAVLGLPPEGVWEIRPSGPGQLILTIVATGTGSDGSPFTAEQTLEINFINKPNFRDCGTDRQDCILKTLRHVETLIHPSITLNESLDTTVDAFADEVLDRYEFGLKLEELMERLDRLSFVCRTCTDSQIETGACPGGDYDERRPDDINLQFSDRRYPTDYAILHELCHVAGFNSDLIPRYSPSAIEMMTALVSGAFPGRSRDCREL